MESPSDQNLVERAQDGDESAFERLVSRHYTTVYRTAYRWCGVREDAEDITQDVFVKVARKIGAFAGRASFRTWLYRITMNTAMDLGRRRSTRRAFSRAWKAEMDGSAENPGEAAAEAVRELYAAIDGLPPRQKAAALLVWAEGFTHKEAASVLECAEATVSAHLFQARKNLQHLLSGTS